MFFRDENWKFSSILWKAKNFKNHQSDIRIFFIIYERPPVQADPGHKQKYEKIKSDNSYLSNKSMIYWVYLKDFYNLLEIHYKSKF